MKFLEAVERSEIILTEGEKKIGKLTFSLFECEREKKENILLLSTYNKPIMKKRLEAIKLQEIKNLKAVLEKISLLSLKENWVEYKAKYGVEFLFKDIKRAVEKIGPDAVIFHRFDLFFEPHESTMIKIFMEEVVNLKEHNLKIFLTADFTQKGSLIEIMENFSDTNLLIKKEDLKRVVSVKNSIFPIENPECLFEIKNNQILLLTYQKEQPSKKFRILIVTKNESLKKLFEYIFDKKDFILDFASSTTSLIEKILNTPDIIIYNPFEEERDFKICKTIKEKNLPSKVIYITNENYIRGDDKIKAVNEGCYEIFPFNFGILEIIAEIKKLLNFSFYTQNIEKLSIQRAVTKKELCKTVNALYNQKIFFSFVKLKTQKELQKEALRKEDILYKDKEGYVLVLINTRAVQIEAVMKKLFDKNEYEITLLFEAPEWIDYQKEICK